MIRRLPAYFLWLFLLGLVSVLLPKTVWADTAVISVDPQSASHAVSDEFNVSLKVSSSPSPFNAAQANVAVSSNLSVESLNYGDCNFTFFQPTPPPAPTPSDPSFTGGIIGGGSTNSCTVYTLVLKALSSGTGTITITNPQVVVISNNTSQNADTSVQNGSYTIGTTSTTMPTPTPTPMTIIEAAPTPTPVPTLTPTPVSTSKPLIKVPKIDLSLPFEKIVPSASNSSKSNLPTVSNYNLEVQVLDKDGSPVTGAHLFLYSTPKEAVTDGDGIGNFSGVEPGRHRLYISYNDSTEEHDIQAKGNDPTLIESIRLGSLTNSDLIKQWLAGIGLFIFVLGLVYSLLSKKRKRKIGHFFYYRVVQYVRVRYIFWKYVKPTMSRKLSHELTYAKRSLRRRLHHFYYFRVWHKLKVKLISLRYIKRVS